MGDDLPYHIPGKFEVGNIVVVARTITEAHAWHDEWTSSHENFVGKLVRVTGLDPIRGYLCVKKELGALWFPSAALDEVSRMEIPVITVPAI